MKVEIRPMIDAVRKTGYSTGVKKLKAHYRDSG